MKLRPVLLGVIATCAPLSSSVYSASSDAPEHFPTVKLRAYGTISAERKVIPGSPQSSVLLITCESEPKAQLVLAKYLSDLSLLPGVTPLPLTTARGSVAARQVEKQGVVAAARCGKKVTIFTAADGPSLQALYESNVSSNTKVNATDAEIPVPMYVDRWDKNGFRFYYGPFVKPQDANHHDIPTYDPTQDFTFAKQSGDVGLVVWNTPDRSDSSEGIMDLNSREWVYKAALGLKLPLGINIGLEDSNKSLINRYPGDMVPCADQYLGGWYGALNFGGKTTAWSSAAVQDVALGQIQPLVRDLMTKYENIVNWLEPHEEMHHGNCDLLDDHGPNAKKSFHAFLKSKYGSVRAVAKQWNQPGAFNSWDEIPFPELATFLGWNASAFDLTGTWKISYDAAYGVDSAKTDLDDSNWKGIQAPGNAIARILPRKPAVFRRHFKLDPAWHAAHPKVWVYVWDMNDTRGGRDNPKGDVLVYMNGQALPENPPHRLETHWGALEVTSALVDGDNVLTICLPQAIIDYRCYLSGEAPGVYPALTPQLNAEWADFSDWTSWSRGQAVRRGAQMIRQVDPDRPITLMSPGLYLSPIKAVAEDYGGIIHDTGGMAGFWTDYNPIMGASTNLPTDCEPGSGAVDLDDFKRFMGRWSTEATQGVDYFQHIGDIEWKPAVKDYFQKTLNLWHLIGKYHVPQAEVALLDSDRNQRLFGFPWNTTDHSSSSPDLILGSGLWAYPLSSMLQNFCPRAGIVEDDFARGNVDQYRIVIDSNTTIMDPSLVDQIEKWVRKGGTFVTFQQTGRHTSALRDSWPITKLTGYAVSAIDSMTVPSNRHLHLVEGQSIFHSDVPEWRYVERGTGQSLKKTDPACEDLLQWDDGSVAAGMRKLGKGLVINLGTNNPMPLVSQILAWAKVKRIPGEVTGKDIILRYFVSNNGLDDVWVMWNTKNAPITTDLLFHDGLKPADCHDVNTGKAIPVDSSSAVAKLANIALEPWQTRAFLTPRGSIATAPADWLTLQRNWWKGTVNPGRPIPAYKPKLALDLTQDWAFKPIDGAVTGTPPEDLSLVDPKLDDSSWKRMEIGIIDIPDYPNIRHAMFRKKFTVPAAWNHGKVRIFGKMEGPSTTRRYIDGQPMKITATNDDLGGILKPGTTHLLAVEMWGTEVPVGIKTPVWISYRPEPTASQSMPNNWSFASDCLTYSAPGAFSSFPRATGSYRTTVNIDPKQAGRNVVVRIRANDTGLRGLIFNGQWFGAYGNIYNYYDINVTPLAKFGKENEVIVVMDGQIQEASLDFYDKNVYP